MDHEVTYLTITDEKPKNKYSPKQRGALHVWCDQCAEILTELGMQCEVVHPFTKAVYFLPWTGIRFKENIYKFVLAAMTGLDSTEKQDSIDPAKVASVIWQRYSHNGVTLAEWPVKKKAE